MITNFSMPFAIRFNVFSASGLTAFMPYFSFISSAVSKMLGHGRDQSIISAAVLHGNNLPYFTSWLLGSPCVGLGQTIDFPSHLATRKNLFRIVGAP